MTDQCINTIMTSSSSVEAVELVGIGVKTLLSNNAQPIIEHLAINAWKNLPGSAFRKLGQFQYLKSLSLKNITFSNEIISVINQGCQTLEKLYLDNHESPECKLQCVQD